MQKITQFFMGITFLLSIGLVSAQELRNVQVLPFKTKREIIPYMKNKVAKSLGVKCNYCHNLKNHSDDSSPNKIVAREMMRMTQNINEQMLSIRKIALKAGKKQKEKAPVIECWACHRGSTDPEYAKP